MRIRVLSERYGVGPHPSRDSSQMSMPTCGLTTARLVRISRRCALLLSVAILLSSSLWLAQSSARPPKHGNNAFVSVVSQATYPDVTALAQRASSSNRQDRMQLARIPMRQAEPLRATLISFAPPSLWDQHRSAVLATIAAFAALLGLIIFFISYTVQRSRRAQAERALSDSEGRVEFATSSTNSGLWQMTADDQPINGLDACADLFGLPRGIPYTLRDLTNAVHPNDRQIFARSMLTAVRRGTPIDFRFRVGTEGAVRWLSARANPTRPDNGCTPVVTGLFTDVTQLKRLEDDRETQRREVAHLTRRTLVNELSSSIAHELNQPLSAIMMNAETALKILGNGTCGVEQVRDALRDILEDDARAAEVVSRVRRLIKRDTERFGQIDIERLFESTHVLLRSEFIRKGIALEIGYEDTIPQITGDFVQLQQILINLLMNAMEASATPAGIHKVLLKAQRHGDKIRIAVVDNGPGIPDDIRDRLFEPFITSKAEGLGLGLSICATIAESHGGEIALEDNPDGGTAANLILPVAGIGMDRGGSYAH
jgi:C4-dicarboxylate-specific signal transduction histidine kinase